MKRQDGFTLLEVLVAVTITLTVMGLTFQAFRGAVATNEMVQAMAESNESLQVASTLISEDVMKAGQNLPKTALSLPYNDNTRTTTAVWPIPGAPALPWPTTFHFITPGNGRGPRVRDAVSQDEAPEASMSDTITVIYTDTSIPELFVDALNVTDSGSTMTIRYDTSRPVGEQGFELNTNVANTVRVGDLFMLTGPGGNILQEVTDAATPDARQQITFRRDADTLRLNQPTMAMGTVRMLADSGGAETAKRVTMVSYFIDRANQRQPLLMRRVNGQPAVPVAVGIENLQISYDLTSSNGTFPNQATIRPADQTPMEIRKVRVYLSVRSENIVPARRDYYRNAITTQINIRSLGSGDAYKGEVEGQ